MGVGQPLPFGDDPNYFGVGGEIEERLGREHLNGLIAPRICTDHVAERYNHSNLDGGFRGHVASA